MFYDSRHTCDALNTGHAFLYTQNALCVLIFIVSTYIYTTIYLSRQQKQNEKYKNIYTYGIYIYINQNWKKKKSKIIRVERQKKKPYLQQQKYKVTNTHHK